MFGPTILHGALGGGSIEVIMKLWGAAGGGFQDCSGNGPNGLGGAGGYVNVTSEENFSKGDTLYVYVGQGGIYNSASTTFGGGGAAGGSGNSSGGGASYVSLNNTADINSLVAVAGAGGSASSYDAVNDLYYTDGGGLIGRDGRGSTAATGGSQVAGGIAGTGGFGGGGTPATNGSFLQGGNGASCKGPGGGGGYYGGGGGLGDCGACAGGGAAGGSSYINSAYFQTINNNDQGFYGVVSSAAQSDSDWNGSAGNSITGQVSNPGGQVVIYINGTKHNFNYTGSVQTLVI